MQITHAEAHKLVQYNLDRALNSEKQRTLLSHLQECDECKAYADGILDMENILRHLMNKKWQYSPLPLSLDSIRPHNGFSKRTYSLFSLQTALIGLILVAFSFLILQLRATMNDPSRQIALSL